MLERKSRLTCSFFLRSSSPVLSRPHRRPFTSSISTFFFPSHFASSLFDNHTTTLLRNPSLPYNFSTSLFGYLPFSPIPSDVRSDCTTSVHFILIYIFLPCHFASIIFNNHTTSLHTFLINSMQPFTTIQPFNINQFI